MTPPVMKKKDFRLSETELNILEELPSRTSGKFVRLAIQEKWERETSKSDLQEEIPLVSPTDSFKHIEFLMDFFQKHKKILQSKISKKERAKFMEVVDFLNYLEAIKDE